jgi:hypothetical protein
MPTPAKRTGQEDLFDVRSRALVWSAGWKLQGSELGVEVCRTNEKEGTEG